MYQSDFSVNETAKHQDQSSQLSKLQAQPFQKRRNSLLQQRNSILQNYNSARLKNFQDQYNQKDQMQQSIKTSINNLKRVISKNVALRKGEDTNGTSSSLANTKFFSNLASIKNHYQQKIENKDLLSADSSNKFYSKGNSINKSLRNISIITQKSERQNESDAYNLIKHGMKDEFSAHKPLYQRYFSENANNFIKSLQDPFDPKLRDKILKSDHEYDKFVSSYLNKVDLAKNKQKLTQSGSMARVNPIKNQFIFEGRDFLTLNKQQNDIEKNFINQISDLDNFQEKHMIETLMNFENGQMMLPQKRKVSASKTRMFRVIQMENEKRKTQTAQGFFRTATSGGFGNTANCTKSIQSGTEKQIQNEQVQGHFISNNYLNSQKLQKKLENQTKKGYHIIKRNQSERALVQYKDEMVRDESDDSLDASRTEATLDTCFRQLRWVDKKIKVIDQIRKSQKKCDGNKSLQIRAQMKLKEQVIHTNHLTIFKS